jgi:fructokinase
MYLICGEALFDVFLNNQVKRDSVNMNARVGGSPFNVAIGLSRLDKPSALLTGVSSDALGNLLANQLKSESVCTDYLLRSGRRTTLSLVTIDDSGQPEYVFYGLGSADCSVVSDDLPPIGDDIIGLHFGSYSLVVKPVADAFATLLNNAGDRFVSIDPNVRPTIEPNMQVWRERIAQYANRAQLLKISTEDLAYLFPDSPIHRHVENWLAAGVKLVVVTDGDKEVNGWTQSGLHSCRKPLIREVVDTVGAGDTFQAALLAQLAVENDPSKTLSELNQQKLDDLLDYAANAASITCSRRGANLPYRHELL